jgi:hypothetical protein
MIKVEVIASRIRSEYRKYHNDSNIDWALMAAHKINAEYNHNARKATESAEEILAEKINFHKTLFIIPGSPLHVAVIEAMKEFASQQAPAPDGKGYWSKIADIAHRQEQPSTSTEDERSFMQLFHDNSVLTSRLSILEQAITKLQEKYDENGYDCSPVIKLQRIEQHIQMHFGNQLEAEFQKGYEKAIDDLRNED